MKIASTALFAEFVHPSTTPGRSRPVQAMAFDSGAPAAVRTSGFASTVAAALPVGADAAAGDATQSGSSDAERTEAVAQFAQALWQAMHESGRGDGRRGNGHGAEHHDNGRRAHGWNRNPHGYAGLVPQLERLISRYVAEGAVPPPVDAGTEPVPVDSASAPVDAAARAVTPASAETVGTAPSAPAVSAADAADGTEVAAAPADGEPSDTLPVPDPLMAAFGKMLEAFGVKLPAGDLGGVPLADFLSRFAEGLRSQWRDASGCGCFVSVSA